MQDPLKLFETGQKRYQPDPAFKYTDDPKYVLDQQFLALLVGLVALGLPFAMMIGALFGTCFYDSISHFYYAQFLGAVLVAALAFIGTFLIAYRGENPKESALASWAGIFAFGVALAPTEGRGCQDQAFSGRILADLNVISPLEPAAVVPATRLGEFFALFPYAQTIHFTSAAVLFAFLAYYSFRVFTRTIDDQHLMPDGRLTPVKQTRNGLYVASGWVIVVSMLAILTNTLHTYFTGTEWVWWDRYNVTFWFEALALWAFGVSWMVKGRFWGLLRDQRDKAAR